MRSLCKSFCEKKKKTKIVLTLGRDGIVIANELILELLRHEGIAGSSLWQQGKVDCEKQSKHLRVYLLG